MKINLRDYYPDFYKHNYILEIPNEIASMMHQWQLDDEAYRIRTYRAKAYFSLDRNDGIEYDVVFSAQSPDELYECKLTMQQLNDALAQLPIKQSQRIYAHIILGKSKAAIARAEGVNESNVRKSIERGLLQLKKFLKFFD